MLKRPAWLGGSLTVAAVPATVLCVVDMRLLFVAAVLSMAAGRWAGQVRVGLQALAVALGVAALVATAAPYSAAAGSRLIAGIVLGGMLPWLLGLAWRQAGELVRAGWDRAERLEREQALAEEQARLRERTRIAQDMHDALGHDLSLIALRAGALKLAPDLPEAHRAAAADVRASAAAAVERLGEVIGVLREPGEAGAPVEPAGIAEVVERVAASGLDVRLVVVGDAPTPAPMRDRAATRVVQEALTNVAKHATGAATTVHVEYQNEDLDIEVVNGPGTAAVPGTGGLGLVGLRERVRLAGGTFEAGPRGDGFAVVAHLPAQAVPAAAPAPHTGAHWVRARRRVTRTVVASVLVPVLSFVALTGTLWVWGHVLNERAVLDADVYAGLRVGQSRAEIAPLLPDRQAPYPPPPAPRPAGAACEHYAITGDPFDSRAGDAYRLCFRDGTLISLDRLIW